MAAIGQGNTAVTPLQLAAYAATLANYGQRPALHYADRAVSAATGETLWQYTPTFTAVQGRRGRVWPHPGRHEADGPDDPRAAGGPGRLRCKNGQSAAG